jgi:hypothetical protein
MTRAGRLRSFIVRVTGHGRNARLQLVDLRSGQVLPLRDRAALWRWLRRLDGGLR